MGIENGRTFSSNIFNLGLKIAWSLKIHQFVDIFYFIFIDTINLSVPTSQNGQTHSNTLIGLVLKGLTPIKPSESSIHLEIFHKIRNNWPT